MDGLEQPIRAVTDRLLAEMSAAGRFDLAEDVALRLPREVLVEFLGVPPGERADLLDWSRRIVNLGDPDYHPSDAAPGSAFENIYGYLLSLARRRETAPCDDLFSVLLSARFHGDRLTPVEVAHFATTVMNAGMETVYSSITAGVPALLEQPGQPARLRADRELIPRTVSTSRAVPTRMSRSAVAGRTYLAAMELRCFLESWLDRLGELELTGEPVHTETNVINSYKQVPVRFR